MVTSLSLPLLALVLALVVSAHGNHGHDHHDHDTGGIDIDGLDNRGYAEKHMNTEHHIDSFDLESFFNLHDFDQNRFLDLAEVEAIYGLHHPSAHKNNPSDIDAQEIKRKVVTDKVFSILDTNKDGMISLEEFLAGGIDGLPSFATFGDLGHHYDEESEYFLHHEELYHSTPETQTDESYNHPEDLEHFAHHKHIEDQEDHRERVFEGLSDDQPLGHDIAFTDPLDQHAHGDDAQAAMEAISGKPARIDRSRPGKVDLEKAAAEAARRGPYGAKDYHRPRSAEDKLRKGVPYKYKMAGKNLRNEF